MDTHRLVVAALIASMGLVGVGQQDELARLISSEPPVVSLDLQDAEVATVLEILADLGAFDVYVTPELAEAAPVTLRVEETDLLTVLRFLEQVADLTYRVLEDGPLLVSGGFVANYWNTSAARVTRPRCVGTFHLC